MFQSPARTYKITENYPGTEPPLSRNPFEKVDYRVFAFSPASDSTTSGSEMNVPVTFKKPTLSVFNPKKQNKYSELQYKRPKRKFLNKEARLSFIKTYQSKMKTEVYIYIYI